MNITRRKQAWLDFYDLNSSTNRLLIIECTEDVPPQPIPWWTNMEERMEWAYIRYQKQLERMETLPDFTVPHLSTISGTEIFAEAFGCPVHRPPDNMPFALPRVFSAQEAAKLKTPRLEDTRLPALLEMGHKLRARAGRDALLSLPDIQTPGDVAALIWEKTDFYAAMLEEPQAVLEMLDKIRELMFAFLDIWFKEFGPDFIAHYPAYYMPFGVTMSEDEIGAVSPAMYKQFFENNLKLFSQRYGQIGIHCCADSRHQWENLSGTPNLRLINLHRDAPQTEQSMDVFRSVCAQMPAAFDADPEKLENPSQLHIVKFTYAQTLKQAQEIMNTFYAKYPHMRGKYAP